jgi:hypothetical protein
MLFDRERLIVIQPTQILMQTIKTDRRNIVKSAGEREREREREEQKIKKIKG